MEIKSTYLNDGVLDATQIPMRIKHETILETFVNLKVGESFILSNDHDPRPLKYQFDAEYTNAFTWEYIKQGPDVFQIKIEKTAALHSAPENYVINGVLDATKLPLQGKHRIILDTFHKLSKGESFILHNDHDPLPLKYQMTNLFGETFDWTYLQQGSTVFEVKIAKHPAKTSNSSKEEKVLDGICLDPSVKFQTIMKAFNDLKEGEGFILHNDHDPKPLYYKLSSDFGDTFTWEYLKQGPEVFEIRIAKKNLATSPKENKSEVKENYFEDGILFDEDTPETLRTLTATDYRKTSVFRKHGIDYAWKGDRSLNEVCSEMNILESKLREELKKVENNSDFFIPSQDYYHWNMSFLADFILQTHHKYVKDNAEVIALLAEKAAEELGEKLPVTKELGEKVRPMLDDFMVHMSKEEDVLFPAIKQMLSLLKKGEKSPSPGGAIRNAVIKMEEEHDETRVYLEHFREITQQYAVNEGTNELLATLYTTLKQFENDTYLHVHLENNILFPKLILLERIISDK